MSRNQKPEKNDDSIPKREKRTSFSLGSSSPRGAPPSHTPRRSSPSPPRPAAAPTSRGPGSKFKTDLQHSPESTVTAKPLENNSLEPSFNANSSTQRPMTKTKNDLSPRKKKVVISEVDAVTQAPVRPPFMPQRYCAQSAYTQKNPFRVQSFEEFAAYPVYAFPPGFHTYADCKMYNFDSVRATQGEFLLQRLADASDPISPDVASNFLNTVVEKLQEGEWFFKWSRRTDKVHRRYFWINLQRGTFMWSLSEEKVTFFNSEVKLLTVVKVLPDCIQDGPSRRTFYRIRIESPEKSVCIATEKREKFDVWFKALKSLTAVNSSSGVPGIWSRPSQCLNYEEGGTLSRWSQRYSPLNAIVEQTNEELGGIRLNPTRVASSD